MSQTAVLQMYDMQCCVSVCVCEGTRGDFTQLQMHCVTMFGKSYPHTHTFALTQPIDHEYMQQSWIQSEPDYRLKDLSFSHFNILSHPRWLSLPLLSFVFKYYISSELKQNYMTPFSTGRAKKMTDNTDRQNDRQTDRQTEQ